MSELLEKLNKNQKEAVSHLAGPLLVVAGAGTGKTTVLINRLAYLVIEKKVEPDNILLLTFTEKAATEMEERADKILPYGYIDLWINTFHGFCEKILREHALEIGLNPDFKLLSETDQWVFIKKNLASFNLDYYRPLGNPSKFISELIKHFSRLKDENIRPEKYLDYADKLLAELGVEVGEKGGKGVGSKKEEINNDRQDEEDEVRRIKELAEAYSQYKNLMLQNNYLDFGDLILYTIDLFTQRKNILKFYQNKFKYVMVDEFQDTNLSQYDLVKMLTAFSQNLMVVGDDDQSIYRFRGTSIYNIMQFKEDFKDAKEVVLNDNYRSRQEILDLSHNFIQHNNPNRLEDKLKISKSMKAKNQEVEKSEYPALSAYCLSNAEAEVSFVASEIDKIYSRKIKNKEDVSWSDFAILVRANNSAEAFVKELSRQNIPNQFMSWKGLYHKNIILDALAYFRLLDNYHESSALFRVLNMEAFKVKSSDIIAINKMARRKVWSLFEALKNIDSIRDVSLESVKNIKKLLQLISQHTELVKKEGPAKIFLHYAYDCKILEGLDRDRDIEQFSYLNQFYQKIRTLEAANYDMRLKDLLEVIDLEMEAGDSGALKFDLFDSEQVKIMTVHGAKGLEFKHVFIVNLADKKFPTIHKGEKISIPEGLIGEKSLDAKDAHLEEERRLFYVACTRAKETLYLTYAKDYGGVREKKPSRFFEEMNLDKQIITQDDGGDDNKLVNDLKNLNEKDSLKADDKKEIKKRQEKYPLPAKFSFSQLAAFSACPLQYKFAFILKIPASQDKASLIFGRVMHNTLYNFLLPHLEGAHFNQTSLFSEEKKAGHDDSEKRLLEIYDDNWQKDGYESKEQRAEYYQNGKKALKLFYLEYSKNRNREIVYLEKNFSFKIGQDVIKGTIDRVDRLENGELEIIDYKTGAKKDKLSYDQKRQLILYQVFLEEYLRQKVGKLSYYYLEADEKVSFSASESDIIKLKEQIKAEIKSIKERDFSPTPGYQCKYCDFNSICEFRQL